MKNEELLNFKVFSANARRCNFREVKGKRSMVLKNVTTVKGAVEILRKIAE